MFRKRGINTTNTSTLIDYLPPCPHTRRPTWPSRCKPLFLPKPRHRTPGHSFPFSLVSERTFGRRPPPTRLPKKLSSDLANHSIAAQILPAWFAVNTYLLITKPKL